MVFRSWSLLILLPATGMALTPMDDSSLSAVSGRDGLTVNLGSADGIKADQITWLTDEGATDREARTHFRDLSWTGQNGNPMRATFNMDVGSDGTNPMAALEYAWDPGFYEIGAFTLETPTNTAFVDQSLGQLGWYSEGSIKLVNQGLFRSDGSFAQLDFNMTGDLILRQGDPGTAELSFGNLVFANRFTNGASGGHMPANGTVGVTTDGLLIKADHTYTDFRFDLMYKQNPDNFDRDGRAPLIHAGWTGGLSNALMEILPGGVSYDLVGDSWDYTTNRSEGLLFRAQWDYDTDFGLVLGHADGDRTQLTLSDWTKLGGTPGPMLSMDVILDILQNNTGPFGLCFGSSLTGGQPNQTLCESNGGEFLNTSVAANDSAFAFLVRNGHLHAYSSKMNVLNPSSGWSQDYDFGLILTMGKLDADVLIYPRGAYSGNEFTGTEGLKMDINLLAQSPGYWDKANSKDPAIRATAGNNWATNSHLMFANTASGVGVGILNNDVLWQTRDMFIRIGDTDTNFPDMPKGLMLSSDTFARYYLRGLFGAGELDNLGSNTANVALWQFNLAANKYRFVLYPSTKSYMVPDGAGGTVSESLSTIGFAGFFNLDGSSYLSLAELSMPQASFNLYNVEGSLGWKDGNVVMKSGDQNVDGAPTITIENQLLIGESVDFGNAANAGTPLIGNVGFGDQNYGRIAMPGGVWHSEIEAKVP